MLPALPNNNMVSLLHTETWRYMCWNVWMSLLIPKRESNRSVRKKKEQKNKATQFIRGRMNLPLVFLNKMKVVAANNDCPIHLGTMTSTSKNATSDGNIASKWAFLINVSSWTRRQSMLVSSITRIQSYKYVRHLSACRI